MRKHLIIFCVVLTGCATATTINGPDGQQAQLIECNGAMLTISSCFKKANDVCPAGYALLQNSESQGSPVTTFGAYGLYSASPTYRQIIVRCNSGG
jgi:hypothetical protein